MSAPGTNPKGKGEQIDETDSSNTSNPIHLAVPPNSSMTPALLNRLPELLIPANIDPIHITVIPDDLRLFQFGSLPAIPGPNHRGARFYEHVFADTSVFHNLIPYHPQLDIYNFGRDTLTPVWHCDRECYNNAAGVGPDGLIIPGYAPDNPRRLYDNAYANSYRIIPLTACCLLYIAPNGEPGFLYLPCWRCVMRNANIHVVVVAPRTLEFLHDHNIVYYYDSRHSSHTNSSYPSELASGPNTVNLTANLNSTILVHGPDAHSDGDHNYDDFPYNGAYNNTPDDAGSGEEYYAYVGNLINGFNPNLH